MHSQIAFDSVPRWRTTSVAQTWQDLVNHARLTWLNTWLMDTTAAEAAVMSMHNPHESQPMQSPAGYRTGFCLDRAHMHICSHPPMSPGDCQTQTHTWAYIALHTLLCSNALNGRCCFCKVGQGRYDDSSRQHCRLCVSIQDGRLSVSPQHDEAAWQ